MVDCSMAVGGDSIPQDVMEIKKIYTEVQFVHVVEKDTVLQKLLEEGV